MSESRERVPRATKVVAGPPQHDTTVCSVRHKLTHVSRHLTSRYFSLGTLPGVSLDVDVA